MGGGVGGQPQGQSPGRGERTVTDGQTHWDIKIFYRFVGLI